MVCPGIVTNVTNFGAFVDIGVHQDGLVHLSQLADRFVKDPREVVSPGDRVTVKVLDVDTNKNQISLTMRSLRPDHKELSMSIIRERSKEHRILVKVNVVPIIVAEIGLEEILQRIVLQSQSFQITHLRFCLR